MDKEMWRKLEEKYAQTHEEAEAYKATGVQLTALARDNMDSMIWAALTRAGAPLQRLQVQKKDIQQTTIGITVQAHLLSRTLEGFIRKIHEKWQDVKWQYVWDLPKTPNRRADLLMIEQGDHTRIPIMEGKRWTYTRDSEGWTFETINPEENQWAGRAGTQALRETAVKEPTTPVT